MSKPGDLTPSTVERIKAALVGLKMPRALEIVDATVRRIKRGELTVWRRSERCWARSSVCVAAGG